VQFSTASTEVADAPSVVLLRILTPLPFSKAVHIGVPIGKRGKPAPRIPTSNRTPKPPNLPSTATRHATNPSRPLDRQEDSDRAKRYRDLYQMPSPLDLCDRGSYR
jgi:hypothetical protein